MGRYLPVRKVAERMALRIAPDVALDLIEEERGGALPERPALSFTFD